MRMSRRPIEIMRRSCSDSLLTASQSDGVFGSDTRRKFITLLGGAAWPRDALIAFALMAAAPVYAEQAVKCLKPDGTEESCASRQSYFEPTKRYDAEGLEKGAAHAQNCDKIFQRPYYNTAELDTPPDSPEKAHARAERVAYINCLAEKHETENSSKTEAPAPPPLPPNVSPKLAGILPPVEYDHPYNGKLTVAIVNKEQMARLCPKASLYPIRLACAYPYETMSMCQIVMITDDIIAAAGLTPKIVLRHELGHCNGWHNDHRGARVLPENEWRERTRSEGRKK
jgi:hypothetical protein